LKGLAQILQLLNEPLASNEHDIKLLLMAPIWGLPASGEIAALTGDTHPG
jgi:hypothetical protein